LGCVHEGRRQLVRQVRERSQRRAEVTRTRVLRSGTPLGRARVPSAFCRLQPRYGSHQLVASSPATTVNVAARAAKCYAGSVQLVWSLIVAWVMVASAAPQNPNDHAHHRGISVASAFHHPVRQRGGPGGGGPGGAPARGGGRGPPAGRT